MSLLDDTKVILSNPYESVNATDSFSVEQGLYAQTSVPDVGVDNVVTFGIVSDNTAAIPGPNYTISFTNSSGLKWFLGGSLAGAYASGTYTDGDLFAVYANPQEVVFTQNGTVIQKYPSTNAKNVVPPIGSSYKLFLLFAYVATSTTLTFPKTLFAPSGARGSQGRTYTTLQVESGSAETVTPSAFTLKLHADTVVSQEFLSPNQGIYLQFRISDIPLNEALIIAFAGANLNLKFALKIDKVADAGTESDYTINVAGPDKLDQILSGGLSSGDLISMYLDYKVFIVSRNGVPYNITTITGATYPLFYVSSLDTKYQLSTTCIKSSSNAIFLTDVMFYPTGSPGSNGDSMMELVAEPDNSRVLSPNSIRLLNSAEATYTAESIDGLTSGIMCQFTVPLIPPFINTEYNTDGNQIDIGLYLVGNTSTYCRISFTNAGYACDTTTGGMFGNESVGTYVSTDVFSMYSDGTTIYYYKNGVTIAASPYDLFTPVQMRLGVASDVLYPYDITNIRFYPTGKIGPDGQEGATFFTLVENSAVPGLVYFNSKTSVTLYSDADYGGNVVTAESINIFVNGLVFQVNAPAVGPDNSIIVGTLNSSRVIGISFGETDFTIIDLLTQTILYGPTNYAPGDIFKIQSDGTNVYYSQSGITIFTDSLSLYTDPVVVGAIAQTNTSVSPITVDGIKFYSTGNRGPSGPSGPQGIPGTAGGLVLYLNAPTETINSNAYYQLDNTLSSSQQTYSATIPGSSAGTLTNRFVVTSGNTPSVIPGGLWDLNVWAYDSATAGIQMYFMVKVITNVGGAVSTLLASSNVVNINGTSSQEYILSGYIPTTAIAIGNRVVIEVYANNTNGAGHNLTYQWGFSTTPSHIHTSISIAITGAPGATGAGGALGYYGNFLNSVSQTFTANTNTAFLLNGTVENSGVSIDPVTASRIVVANAGTYNFQFSAQLYANSGTTNFIIWYRINGTDIAQSASDIYLRNNEYAVASWNFVQTMTAGQYFQLMGLADANNVLVQALSAVTGPPARPAIPALILTVTQVMYTQIGPSGPSGVSGVSGVSGPSGVSGVSGVSGPSGVSGVSGPVGPVASSISISSVTGTSLTSGTTPAISTSTYGTYYYLTNSGFNALTLPTTTAGSTVGSYWVLRNNTSTYLSIAITNNANISTPLVIPPSNATTIVVTTASSSPAYTLF